jgi:peptide deformylase
MRREIVRIGHPVLRQRAREVERHELGSPEYPHKPPIPLTAMINPVIEPLDAEVVTINEGWPRGPSSTRWITWTGSRSSTA